MTQTNKIGVMADISYLSVFRPVALLEGKGREGKGREEKTSLSSIGGRREKARREGARKNRRIQERRAIERCDAMRCDASGEETPIDLTLRSTLVCPTFF